MYKKILVPLDGSHRSEAILPHVEELAHLYGARVIFMSVVDQPNSTSNIQGMSSVTRQNIVDQHFNEMRSYLKAHQNVFRRKQIDADFCLRQGEVVDRIIEVAEGEDADLIAIASHARSGLGRMIYGSVAEGVLQRAGRSLLLIRANGR